MCPERYVALLAAADVGAVAPVVEPASVTSIAPLLVNLDAWLRHGAVAAVTVVIALWLARSRRDPLRTAPPRDHQFSQDGLVLLIIVYLLSSSAIFWVFRKLFHELPADHTSAVASAVVQVVGVTACLVMAARQFSGGAVRFALGQPSTGFLSTVGLTVVVTLAAIGLCNSVLLGTVWVIRVFDPEYTFAVHRTIETLRGGGATVVTVLLWVGACALAPIGEEMFFRGILQSFAAMVLRSRWGGILFASAAFASVHFTQPETVPALFVLGLLLGSIYERTGSLIPVFVIHALFNLRTLIWEACGAFRS